MTGTGGQYTATWPNPALAGLSSPDIKVTAADTIGGSITQTITRAYTIVSVAHGVLAEGLSSRDEGAGPRLLVARFVGRPTPGVVLGAPG